MSQQIYGVDLDGVIANFNRGYLRLLAEMTGRQPVNPETYVPDTWDYAESLGFAPQEIANAWARIRDDAQFWYRLTAYPGTFDFLYDLTVTARRDDYDLYFITSRPGRNVIYQSAAWLMLHGAQRLHSFSVIVTDQKGLIAAGLQLDAFLDDKWANVRNVKAARPKSRVYLLKQPWNQFAWRDALNAGIVLIDTLNDFLRVEALGGEKTIFDSAA